MVSARDAARLPRARHGRRRARAPPRAAADRAGRGAEGRRRRRPGGLRAAVGDLTLWSGSRRDQPGSHVFLALSSSGSRGFIELGSRRTRIVHLVPDASAALPGLPVGPRRARSGPGGARSRQSADFCAEALEVPGAPRQTASLELGSTPTTGALRRRTAASRSRPTTSSTRSSARRAASTNYVTELIGGGQRPVLHRRADDALDRVPRHPLER